MAGEIDADSIAFVTRPISIAPHYHMAIDLEGRNDMEIQYSVWCMSIKSAKIEL